MIHGSMGAAPQQYGLQRRGADAGAERPSGGAPRTTGPSAKMLALGAKRQEELAAKAALERSGRRARSHKMTEEEKRQRRDAMLETGQKHEVNRKQSLAAHERSSAEEAAKEAAERAIPGKGASNPKFLANTGKNLYGLDDGGGAGGGAGDASLGDNLGRRRHYQQSSSQLGDAGSFMRK